MATVRVTFSVDLPWSQFLEDTPDDFYLKASIDTVQDNMSDGIYWDRKECWSAEIVERSSD